MFLLFYLFHRLSISGRELHAPPVPPYVSVGLSFPPCVYVWEKFACFTCSTNSTGCLYLGYFSHVPLVPRIPPVAPVPPGVNIWESFIFSTCLTCYTCSPGCLYLGKICLIHLFRLFYCVSMSGRDTHVPLVLPFSFVPCVYVFA